MEEDDDVLCDVDGDDDDDGEDEDDIEFVYDGDEDDDADVDGDDGDPFFILTSSKSNKNKLRFPLKFVALARIDTRETITLENYDGSGKEMSVQSDKKSKSTSYYVAAGWKEFQRSNDISDGDKCVFKFITSEDKICLVKITKKKTPARPLITPASDMDVEDDDRMDDMDVEDDNDKDEDEDVEFVDEDDPFFVVTITPTHNYVLRMPEEFVRSAGIDSKKTLTLRSLDGYEMAMPVQFDTQYGYHTKRYFLLKGWKDFVRASNISKGDKCVFKFITSEDKLCLANITKPPPAAEALETEVNDNDENENEDVEPVDDVDPFFVVTITTGHISRLYLPTDFVGLSGIDTKENIIMISLDGSESQMAVWKGKRQPASTRYHLTEGWNAFMHRNNISKGDKCVFKYITSEDKMCLAKIIKALATEVDVDDMDPSFVVTISITQKHMLRLPPDFVALARIDTKENIIMKSLDGNESQMAVRPDKRFKSAQYNLSLGWVAFKQNNNISQGDECVFKYITSEDKMCLVKVTKASAMEVDDGMNVEDDNDTDEDENAKLVDDADPFFVVTITTTHKTMLLLPTDFVALARIGTKKNVIIKSLDGIETQMALQSYKLRWSTRYCFSVGWRAFKRSNNISDGDECVFKYIKSEDKMCLGKITKKITRATQLPAEVDNDDMDDEDVDDEGKGEDAKLADEDDDNDNEEDNYDYDHDGYDGDPSFILTISKSNQYKLRFSPDFVALARIDTRETITLKNDDGYEKEMPVRSDKRRKSTSYYVATGWKEFQQSNDILQGDKCVFKFITSEDKICLAKITKRKTPARPLPPAAKAPATERFLSDFVTLARIDKKKTIVFKNLNGYEKEMAVQRVNQFRSSSYSVASGWKEFLRDTDLTEGDICVFKFIRSEDKICLAKITKKKTPARPLPTAIKSPRLPKDFVALAKIDTKENIIIKSLDGNERQMVIQSYQCRVIRYHFSIGWPAFMRSNNISEGDECEFKYIRSEDKMCLVKVTKRKTQARSLPPAAVDTETKLMPVDFVRSVGIDTKKTITLKSLDGYEKEIFVRVETKYHYQAKRYFLGKGWMDFARNTNISTRLSSPAKVVKRKRGQPDKVVKRKRGRPAKVVKRKRGRPAKIMMTENVKITAAEVVKGKRDVDTCVEAS
ncbi:B3 domain-containing protein [Artemisia annua]|uniref:B3 domain-containing protein n=1 Tax=Artemisia annua TaxID=35608 RepID=A0A2U1KY08_ARTAN|nr:B3 domain-containing protein [Artemisia annua]